MTTPEPTIADVYANLATELDEGEHPGITLHDLMAAVIEMAPEVFAAAIRKSTDAVLAEKIPAIEGAVRASERARLLAVAERLKEPHTQPGTLGSEYAVPLTLLRAALAAAEAPPQRVTADAGGMAAFWLTVDGEEGDIILSAPCADTLGCLWSFRADGERVTLGELTAAAGTHTGMAAGKLHAELAVATGEDGTQYNNGHPLIWSTAVAPGGWVCAVPAPGNPDGICGMPVESEPCSKHRDPSWRPE